MDEVIALRQLFLVNRQNSSISFLPMLGGRGSDPCPIVALSAAQANADNLTHLWCGCSGYRVRSPTSCGCRHIGFRHAKCSDPIGMRHALRWRCQAIPPWGHTELQSGVHMSIGSLLSLAPKFTSHRSESDKDLLEVAEARLRHSSYLELRSISCDVYAGALTLRGSVSSYYLRQVAQSLVLGLTGIETIDNRLEVVPARSMQGRFVGS